MIRHLHLQLLYWGLLGHWYLITIKSLARLNQLE